MSDIKKTKFESGENDWEKIAELYQEKKEIGKNIRDKLKDRFYRIVNQNTDVFEVGSVSLYPRAEADKNNLQRVLEDLELAQGIVGDYRKKLEELNQEIKVLEEQIGAKTIEEDYRMSILKTEAEFQGDDLAFRPIREWYQPTISKIKEIL